MLTRDGRYKVSISGAGGIFPIADYAKARSGPTLASPKSSGQLRLPQHLHLRYPPWCSWLPQRLARGFPARRDLSAYVPGR